MRATTAKMQARPESRPTTESMIPHESYVCIRCRARVYVRPEHHAYLCTEYREQTEGQDVDERSR